MKAFSSLVLILSFACQPTARAETVTATHADGTKTVSVVDSRNNPLGTSDYGGDGSLTKKSVFERDQEGKVPKMTVQSADGKVKRTENYSYDQNGRAIATRRTTEVGSVWLRQEMYDKHGNHLQSRFVDPKGNGAKAEDWERGK